MDENKEDSEEEESANFSDYDSEIENEAEKIFKTLKEKSETMDNLNNIGKNKTGDFISTEKKEDLFANLDK